MAEPILSKFKLPPTKLSRPIIIIIICVAVAVFGFIFIRNVSRLASNKITQQMKYSETNKGIQMPDVPGYQKLAIEKEMERRVQNIMDEIVGPQKSIVRVTVDLTPMIQDKEEVHTPRPISTTKEEKYTVSSERGTEDKAAEEPAGTAAKKENLPGVFDDVEDQIRARGGEEYFLYPGYPSVGDLEAKPMGRAPMGSNQEKSGTKSVREASSTDYALDKKITERTTPAGTIDRISVLALVDVNWIKTFTGRTIQRKRSEKELDQIKTLITDAIGVSEDRGDTIIMQNVAFLGARPKVEMMERITTGITVLILLPLIYFIVKTTLTFLKRRAEIRQEMIEKMQQEEEAEKERKIKEEKELRERIQMHQEQVFTIGRTHPDICARIIRNWLT